MPAALQLVTRGPKARQHEFDFGVPEDALADEDLRDQVLAWLVSIPEPHRTRALRALRFIAAAPLSERVRAVDDADELAGVRSA